MTLCMTTTYNSSDRDRDNDSMIVMNGEHTTALDTTLRLTTSDPQRDGNPNHPCARSAAHPSPSLDDDESRSDTSPRAHIRTPHRRVYASPTLLTPSRARPVVDLVRLSSPSLASFTPAVVEMDADRCLRVCLFPEMKMWGGDDNNADAGMDTYADESEHDQLYDEEDAAPVESAAANWSGVRPSGGGGGGWTSPGILSLDFFKSEKDTTEEGRRCRTERSTSGSRTRRTAWCTSPEGSVGSPPPSPTISIPSITRTHSTATGESLPGTPPLQLPWESERRSWPRQEREGKQQQQRTARRRRTCPGTAKPHIPFFSPGSRDRSRSRSRSTSRSPSPSPSPARACSPHATAHMHSNHDTNTLHTPPRTRRRSRCTSQHAALALALAPAPAPPPPRPRRQHAALARARADALGAGTRLRVHAVPHAVRRLRHPGPGLSPLPEVWRCVVQPRVSSRGGQGARV
ncbi:hypothetical protein BU17DRAFT_66986 [Hysterangium stoloniferum]|nr:hypothetical protein BU17DRAFT_66986 [Hysterangium stoloniferum]